MDIKKIAMLKDLLEDEFPLLVQLYSTDAPSNIDKMRTALFDKDFILLHKTAHSLKGSSANLGATKLSALCLQIEGLSLDNPSDEIIFLIDELERELKIFLDNIYTNFLSD